MQITILTSVQIKCELELWFSTPVLYIYVFPFSSINNGKPGNQLHLLMWFLAKNLSYFGNMLVVPVDFMQWGHWFWCTHVMFFWNTPMSSKYASRCRNRKAILLPQRWRKNWHWMVSDATSRQHPSLGILLAGDFNQFPDSLLTSYPLQQIVKVKARGQSTLDKVFTNIKQWYD